MPKYYTVNDFFCPLAADQKLMDDPVYAHDMEHVFDRQNLLNALKSDDCCPNCGKSISPETLQTAGPISIAINVYRMEKRLISDQEAMLMQQSNELIGDIAGILDTLADTSVPERPNTKANVLFAHGSLSATESSTPKADASTVTAEQRMHQLQYQQEHGFLDTAQETLSNLTTEQEKQKSKFKRF